MVEHLSTLLDDFPGAANQTRCFSHILNLVAKSILRQFDAPKKNTGDNGDGSKDLDDAANVLAGLAQELELNEPAVDDNETDDDNEGDLDLTNDNNDQGDVSHEGLSDEDVLELEASLTPVRLMLAKVSHVSKY